MITIYHYDIQNFFDGLTREITEEEGAPLSWTFTPVPETPDGKFAYFVGPDWIVIDEKPPLPNLPDPFDESNISA
ncbi:hypothetical protein UFOVP155_31 [uncultured Caudovirales phage]|uniref:Uncharacterized protein n=1 Tax=uncultured Caudovirales phage TaxID=2100421 RepID=A0A6J7W9M8_9CAUD|nr:hypothetical protein UFOVP155_31 [uncultured Caudovirales phage]